MPCQVYTALKSLVFSVHRTYGDLGVDQADFSELTALSSDEELQ